MDEEFEKAVASKTSPESFVGDYGNEVAALLSLVRRTLKRHGIAPSQGETVESYYAKFTSEMLREVQKVGIKTYSERYALKDKDKELSEYPADMQDLEKVKTLDVLAQVVNTTSDPAAFIKACLDISAFVNTQRATFWKEKEG